MDPSPLGNFHTNPCLFLTPMPISPLITAASAHIPSVFSCYLSVESHQTAGCSPCHVTNEKEICCYSRKTAVLLNLGGFVSPRMSGNIWRLSWLSQLGGCCWLPMDRGSARAVTGMGGAQRSKFKEALTHS